MIFVSLGASFVNTEAFENQAERVGKSSRMATRALQFVFSLSSQTFKVLIISTGKGDFLIVWRASNVTANFTDIAATTLDEESPRSVTKAL